MYLALRFCFSIYNPRFFQFPSHQTSFYYDRKENSAEKMKSTLEMDDVDLQIAVWYNSHWKLVTTYNVDTSGFPH